jgi:hypothetical protein
MSYPNSQLVVNGWQTALQSTNPADADALVQDMTLYLSTNNGDDGVKAVEAYMQTFEDLPNQSPGNIAMLRKSMQSLKSQSPQAQQKIAQYAMQQIINGQNVTPGNLSADIATGVKTYGKPASDIPWKYIIGGGVAIFAIVLVANVAVRMV